MDVTASQAQIEKINRAKQRINIGIAKCEQLVSLSGKCDAT
jgi:hypothetical protein